MPIKNNNNITIAEDNSLKEVDNIEELDIEDLLAISKKYDIDYKKKEMIWTNNEIRKLNYRTQKQFHLALTVINSRKNEQKMKH